MSEIADKIFKHGDDHRIGELYLQSGPEIMGRLERFRGVGLPDDQVVEILTTSVEIDRNNPEHPEKGMKFVVAAIKAATMPIRSVRDFYPTPQDYSLGDVGR